jgi:hypothetical protein
MMSFHITSVISSTTQLSLLDIEVTEECFLASRLSVLEVLSGALPSSLPAGWHLIVQICQTIYIVVHPPGRSHVQKDGGECNVFDNLYVAIQSGGNFDQDAWTIPSVYEMYSTAAIFSVWATDSICVAC